MRILNSKIHGLLDYSIGFLLFVCPVFFDYDEESIHCRLLVVTGLVLLLTSLLTDYEFFLVKIFSFKTHLIIDFMLGAFLALSPWMFELSGKTVVPHIASGIAIMSLSLLTKTRLHEKEKDLIIKDIKS
jgi:hypothetical protein